MLRASVLRQLPLVLLALVVAEIWLLVVLGGHIGGLAVFGLLVAGAIGGGWIARREGQRAMAAWQQSAMTGETPGPQLATSAMIVVAGVLIAIPGVITDALGLLLLLPPVRGALRDRFGVAFAQRVQSQGLGAMGRAFQTDRGAPPGTIIDVDPADVRENDR
jgi:UPF0716 protein FxsA